MEHVRARTVIESRDGLVAALNSSRSRAQRQRASMLLALKDRPAASLTEIASEIGASRRSVERWWAGYREGGLAAILPSHMLNSRFALSGTDGTADGDRRSDAFSSEALHFLSSVPAGGDLHSMSVRLADALSELLGTNNALVSMDLASILRENPGAPDVNVFERLATRDVVAIKRNDGTRHAEELLQRLAADGVPLHEYYDPPCFDYYFTGGQYLGTILLFQFRDRPPISERSLELMRTLGDFLRFVLSSFVAWHLASNPLKLAFLTATTRIVVEAKLSVAEHMALLQLLRGTPQEEAANHLAISVATYKSHVNAIYHKTRTRNRFQLMGKFLFSSPEGIDE